MKADAAPNPEHRHGEASRNVQGNLWSYSQRVRHRNCRLRCGSGNRGIS